MSLLVVMDRLLAVAVEVVKVVLAFGLLIALARIALGKREGFVQLCGVAIGVTILFLWESGALSTMMQDFANQVSGGSGVPVPFPKGT